MMSLKPGDIVTKLKVRGSRNKAAGLRIGVGDAHTALTLPGTSLPPTVPLHRRHRSFWLQCVTLAAPLTYAVQLLCASC
jgi:hypothetical protein